MMPGRLLAKGPRLPSDAIVVSSIARPFVGSSVAIRQPGWRERLHGCFGVGFRLHLDVGPRGSPFLLAVRLRPDCDVRTHLHREAKWPAQILFEQPSRKRWMDGLH